MRRLLGVLLVAAAAADPASAALPRSTVDRPDEATGPQVHAVYALPADGADRSLDVGGAIENSVALFRQWLASETGGPTLRVDTSAGSLDVSFVRLAKTDAEIASRGPFVRDEVEAGLRAAGLNDPTKLYAVWYDGSSTYACGGAFWPPAILGNAVVMYLRARFDGVRCDAESLALPGFPAGYWEFAMLHDILHGLGLVATCAPHHHLSGHASDSPNDLMWSGNAPWQLPPRLDIGRDDYYGHGRPDCPDLARSPYLTSVEPPPEQPAEPVVAIGRLSAVRPRAGRILQVRAAVTVDGAPAESGSTRCAARIGRRALRAAGRTFAMGSATCRWRIPPGTRGRRVAGTLTAVAGGRALSRSFSAVVR